AIAVASAPGRSRWRSGPGDKYRMRSKMAAVSWRPARGGCTDLNHSNTSTETIELWINGEKAPRSHPFHRSEILDRRRKLRLAPTAAIFATGGQRKHSGRPNSHS